MVGSSELPAVCESQGAGGSNTGSLNRLCALLGSSADEEPGDAMPEGEQVRQSGSNQATHSTDPEAFENLRAFFTILREWDEEDRREAGLLAHSRLERGARTIAEHFTEDVESG